MTEPVVDPSLAATVVLVRSGRSRPEVLLTRRPGSMAFAADLHVFPGGRVDPADAEPSLVARSVLTPLEAARSLGGDLEPALALAAHLGAIRELFEEAGVLLADVADVADGAGADAVVHSRSASLARSALVGGDVTFGTVAAELDLRLRTDLLVPLSRWVTPPGVPRRFDTRFFAAGLPPGARVSFEGDEVSGHAWLTPTAALAAMAASDIAMWLPTSATLQQLEHAASIDEMRERLALGRSGSIAVEPISPDVTRIVMPAGGGVPGQPVCAYLVGRRRHLLIDPGDPGSSALDRALDLAAARGGTVEAIALTQIDPDHAGGAETVAELLGIPVLAGPGAGRVVPYPVAELADRQAIAQCDVPVQAVHTPGTGPEHLAFICGTGDATVVIAGDLDGRRGARTIPALPNVAALAASRDRLRVLAPTARWLSGHPAVD